MSLTEVYKKRRLLIDHNLATDFALWTLWKILEIQEKLMELNFAHNDMHGKKLKFMQDDFFFLKMLYSFKI